MNAKNIALVVILSLFAGFVGGSISIDPLSADQEQVLRRLLSSQVQTGTSFQFIERI